MSSKNENENKRDLLKKTPNGALNSNKKSPTLHNKVGLFNSLILTSNFVKLKNSLNEKNNFLSKYEENKQKKINDFIFDPNIEYDIEKSKIEKVSNIKGINWNNNINNENLEIGKGLGVIKLKQSQREVNFNNSERLKSKKKIHFKDEEIKNNEKKEILFVPKKLVSDRKIFHLNTIISEDLNENNSKVNSSRRENLMDNDNIRRDPVEPELSKPDTENIFISHFLAQVDIPSPRQKKSTKMSIKTPTDELKNSNTSNNIEGLNEINIIKDLKIDSKITNEKNLTVNSNMNGRIKSRSRKYDGSLITEEAPEKSEDSDNDGNSFEQKESIVNQSWNSIKKNIIEEKKKNSNSNNFLFENIRNLYLNDFLTSSPNKITISDLSRKSSGLLSFNNVKNNILSSLNINNLDLNKREDKMYVANKLSSHIFGVRESKLVMNSLFQNGNINNNNNVNNNNNNSNSNNNEQANDDNSNKLSFEIRNSKGIEMPNTRSNFLDNINNDIKKENLYYAPDSPKGPNSIAIRSPFRHKANKNSENEPSSPISAMSKSPKSRKLTIENDKDRLPLLNKIMFNKQKQVSSIKSKQSLNLLNCKNVKNNIIPTLLNKEEVQGNNYSRLKRSETFIDKNKNPNSFHNNLLNKFEFEKANEISQKERSSSPSSSSNKIRSSSVYKGNSEHSSVNDQDSFSGTDEEEIKKEEKDKYENNLSIDSKMLEHLKVLQKMTKLSSPEKINKRKYTIYDKHILRFTDKEIRNEQHDKEVKNIYGKIFGQNLEKILELRKYPARSENQTKADKNIARRKYGELNFVNKNICDMKEKIHFMKGLLDFSYAKIICHKVREIGDNLKKTNLKDKLKKIKKLNENEMQKVIQYFNELKFLDIGEFVTDSEDEQDIKKG